MIGLFVGAMTLLAAQDTLVFSLESATARAVEFSPGVVAARGAIRGPRGERAEAWWPFPENPTLEYAAARRRSPGDLAHDREWVLTQELEIAGQGFVRASAAGKRVGAAEERVADARRLAALEARQSYLDLALSERRAALIDSAAVFAERMAGFAREQLDAGEINRLEYNASILEAARLRSAADRARAALAEAEADLARVLWLTGDTVPRTTDLPVLPDLAFEDETALLSLARSRRPDLRAARLEAGAAAQDVTAARLRLLPNLQLAGFTAREEGDDLLGFSVGLKIPLFHRQQARVGAAAAERARARAELEATERRVRAEVHSAAAAYARARNAEARFAAEVLRAASENVTLTQRAFEAGEVGLAEVILLRSTAVDAQLEYLEVVADAYEAWFDLAAVLNASPTELPELLQSER